MGLSHLIGTNLLRAYMHGHFMDMRLYTKAKQLVNPFAYEEYRQRKIREKLDEQRTERVQAKRLPKVNRDLAERIMLEQTEDISSSKSKRKRQQQKGGANLLEDSRFRALFENPEFQVDPDSEEFQLLNPALVKLEKLKQKKQKEQKRLLAEKFESLKATEETVGLSINQMVSLASRH